MLNQVEYYRTQDVKNRISEFIHDAEYIVGYGECELWQQNPEAYYSAPISHLDGILARGLDMFRSMLGSQGTLISLDIEYYNTKYPGEIYLNAGNVFKNKLQPLREVVKSVYNDFNISYLEVITGQGYHYHTIWPYKSEHPQLEKIGHLEYTLEQQYLHRKSQHGYSDIPVYKGLGYSGAFRLLQFVTIEILNRINKLRAENPGILSVQYCDIVMSSPEGISLDLTIYSDPIYICGISECRSARIRSTRLKETSSASM